MTSDKEGLTDYDIEHLMNDTNGALWRVPGTNNFVACTIHDATGSVAGSVKIYE